MSTYSATPVASVAVERSFLRQVFAWMFLALLLTTGVAAYLNATTDVADWFADHNAAIWIVFAAELGLVFVLSAALTRLSAFAAATLFAIYAGLNGVVFALIFAVYTTASVVGAFAGAAGVFAGMAAVGYTTKTDLSGMRTYLFGGLIGLLAAAIAQAFVGGSVFNFVIGVVGVLLFSAFTAYDMQSIRRMAPAIGSEQDETRYAIVGALRLYLDFVNLVISLLRIFGGRR